MAAELRGAHGVCLVGRRSANPVDFLRAPIFRGFGAMLGIGCAIGAAIRSVQAYRRMVVEQAAGVLWQGVHRPGCAEGISRKRAIKQYWLGRGFPWSDIEATKLHTLMSMGVVRTIGRVAQHP